MTTTWRRWPGASDDEVRLNEKILVEKLPTAGLAVIDFAFGSWDKIHPDAGRLDRFVVPRMLEAATD